MPLHVHADRTLSSFHERWHVFCRLQPPLQQQLPSLSNAFRCQPARASAAAQPEGQPEGEGAPAADASLNYPREFVLRRLLVFAGIVIGCVAPHDTASKVAACHKRGSQLKMCCRARGGHGAISLECVSCFAHFPCIDYRNGNYCGGVSQNLRTYCIPAFIYAISPKPHGAENTCPLLHSAARPKETTLYPDKSLLYNLLYLPASSRKASDDACTSADTLIHLSVVHYDITCRAQPGISSSPGSLARISIALNSFSTSCPAGTLATT